MICYAQPKAKPNAKLKLSLDSIDTLKEIKLHNLNST